MGGEIPGVVAVSGFCQFLPDMSGRGTIRRTVEGCLLPKREPLHHFVVPLPIKMGRKANA